MKFLLNKKKETKKQRKEVTFVPIVWPNPKEENEVLVPILDEDEREEETELKD